MTVRIVPASGYAPWSVALHTFAAALGVLSALALFLVYMSYNDCARVVNVSRTENLQAHYRAFRGTCALAAEDENRDAAR